MTWFDFIERLLTQLEARGEDTNEERAEFGMLIAGCYMEGCSLMEKDRR